VNDLRSSHGQDSLDELKVSQDAADFLVFYGSDPVEISKGFLYVFSTMPRGRVDLRQHWEAVAARVQEMVSAASQRIN
jgi:hypothetical protein